MSSFGSPIGMSMSFSTSQSSFVAYGGTKGSFFGRPLHFGAVGMLPQSGSRSASGRRR
jgi:hypothetical protein